jgi:hypothetical protein
LHRGDDFALKLGIGLLEGADWSPWQFAFISVRGRDIAASIALDRLGAIDAASLPSVAA